MNDIKPRSYEDYTVGWVCTLPKEQAAAMAMLDHRHPDLPKPANDSNTYTLGSIGNHNIVVACLPKGMIGTNSAATVASQMVSTFPKIRVGLMVGIGGGIPPHVRLGDVVVSVPDSKYPGVVQWDLGKVEDGGRFERTGALDKPPKSLLSALGTLEGTHELEPPNLQAYLVERKARYPNSAQTFLRTEALRDVLFKANYSHANNPPVQNWLYVIVSYLITAILWPFGLFNQETSSSHIHPDNIGNKQKDACQYCDKSQVVSREPQGMRVHYGLIASGNQVIKDAAFRDSLNERFGGNVLCVEMEAAGLMDNFPCVVIRGICDYADSHKNKAWQEHAAAIAAAYAKEFLRFLQPSELDREQPARDIMRHVVEIERAVKRIESVEDKKENREILDWLSTIDYGSHHSSILAKWHPETDQWFLGSGTFTEWVESRGKSLYCPGIPGAGKTVLTSAVIHHLQDTFSTRKDIGIAYLYCNFSRQETLETYLSSLIKQLAKSSPSLDVVRGLYNKHEAQNTRPSRKEISEVLRDILGLVTYDQVFIMIDGLDECTMVNECRVELINEITGLQAKHTVNMFATSRPIEEIAVHFKEVATIRILADKDDIKAYMDKRLHATDDELFNSEIRELVISKVVEAMEGMFLLAELYLNSLVTLPTRGHVKHALANLTQGPDGLDKAYRLTMERIKNQGKEYYKLATQILSWIVYAIRPLKIKEMQHALATRPGMKVFDDDFIPSVKKLLSVCAGLVIVDEVNHSLRLFHYTAQDYLEKTENEWCPDPHSKLMNICTTYVSFIDHHIGYNYPFYPYALYCWAKHACRLSSTNWENVLSFFKKEQFRYSYPEKLPELHLAVQWGLVEVVRLLLDVYRLDIDARDKKGRTPLHSAALIGNETMFRLLTTQGADINAKDEISHTPLILAARMGNGSIVKMLLDDDRVDPSHKNQFCQTALIHAASRGHAGVVQVLLDNGRVNPNLGNRRGETALIRASTYGHSNIVQILLANQQVDPDIRDFVGKRKSALSAAASCGHAKIVQILLADKRTNTNQPDKTPLYRAVENGHADIVQLLLDSRQFDMTSLHAGAIEMCLFLAVKGGHAEVAQVLLAFEETNPNMRLSFGDTPLERAIFLDCSRVVDVLLADERTDPNLRDAFAWTPLAQAILCNKVIAVKALLACGRLDPNIKNDNGDTPLLMAVRKQDQAIIGMLLASERVDPDIKNIAGETPLSIATGLKAQNIVDMLVATGRVEPMAGADSPIIEEECSE